MELKWRDSWRKEPSVPIRYNSDGSVSFGGKVGNVFLPDDYKSLLQQCGGITCEGDDNFCLAQYSDGPEVIVLEYLNEFNSVVLASTAFHESVYHNESTMLPGYISIGTGELEDFVMNIIQGDENYGRIYAWERAGDPWGEGDNTRGLGWVADSLNEFLNNLDEEEVF